MSEYVIGQKVAIYQTYYNQGNVKVATVERDTKLYWIADGRKFRKSDGIEPGSNSGWNRPYRLLPLDDPQVVEALTASRRGAAYSAVCAAQNELSKSRESLDAIAALKSALDEYAATIS